MCTTFDPKLHDAVLERLAQNPGKKDLHVYKVYVKVQCKDGIAYRPPFGDSLCGVAFHDTGEVKRWSYQTKEPVLFDGMIESERFENDPLDEMERKFDPYLPAEDGQYYEGYISGIHTYVTARAALIYAWDICGMYGKDTVVIPVSVRREDLLCGGNADFSVREYDYLERGPSIIAFRIYAKVEDFKNPFHIFEYEKNTGKLSLLRALKKVESEKPKQRKKKVGVRELQTA